MANLILRITADHPTAAGHFPGNPILPGALLLAEILRAIAADRGDEVSPCNIKSAKFLLPVRPGDDVEIDYSVTERGTIEFQCAVEGRRVLAGSFGAIS